ncbi:MAG: efflux RND transporter periplasmic adaptor subunit [Lentimicrobiaceae bacterium]
MKRTALILMLAISILSCNRSNNEFDASGTFEAEETIISAEASGIILQLNLVEGQELKQGEVVGYIDSTQLVLKRKQLESQISAVLSRSPDTEAQLAAIRQQMKQAKHEQQRIENLVKAGAATQKQMDDANAQVSIMKSQEDALQSSLRITSSSIGQETNPLKVQIEQLNDLIAKSRIYNPVKGTVLTQYSRVNEMATTGKPLYKIADLSNLTLRAYITGDQLPGIKLNQPVKVMVDDTKGGYKEYKGVIDWISNKSEFTPKTIQTKDERANLVYAVKIRVPNDGYLKIGMYGEVNF